MNLYIEASSFWKIKFQLIEKAGGQPKLPKLKEWTFGERCNAPRFHRIATQSGGATSVIGRPACRAGS